MRFCGIPSGIFGHIVSPRGVAADPKKTEAMRQWPVPKDLKGLRGFLGLTRYYRRFVKNYGLIAKPLTDLTKKDAFLWSDAAQQAFVQLKNAMADLPILAVPDFSQPFILETDASSQGLGAVLSQKGRPIAYLSQALSPRAQKKSVYERELMAIVLAVQKWRHYLLGRHFIIMTDQRSLTFLTEQRLFGEDQLKWTSKLMGMDFEIQFRPGLENKAADALSRQMMYQAISVVRSSIWDTIDAETAADPQLKQIILALQQGSEAFPGFSLQKGRLFYQGRAVLPKDSSQIPVLLAEFHDSATGGHSGFLRTYKRLAAAVYWKGMRKQVKDYVASCQTCQTNKYEALSPGGLLQPLAIPDQVWSEVSLDFISGLPKSKGKDAIMVVVDRFTKYAHFLALAHPFTAKEVAHLFVKEIVRLHGFPRAIVSDRDPVFLSHFWSELFRQAGTKLKYSTSYHPQTDGQTEVTNRCLETYLRCFVCNKPKQWVEWLAWAEYWFNTSFNASTRVSPFQALYGRPPPTLFRGETYPSKVPEVQALVATCDEVLAELKDHLCMA